MEISILHEDKGSVEVEISNVTVAEVLRNYLNQDSNVEFAAWRRDHPTKNAVLKVKAKSPKKAVKDASSAVTKDLEKTSKEFSKLK
ncbi:MAG: RpoL/Rpb11 RNA polymerase subunit family protein [Candidatus Pacearchaeota archaeon]